MARSFAGGSSMEKALNVTFQAMCGRVNRKVPGSNSAKDLLFPFFLFFSFLFCFVCLFVLLFFFCCFFSFKYIPK